MKDLELEINQQEWRQVRRMSSSIYCPWGVDNTQLLLRWGTVSWVLGVKCEQPEGLTIASCYPWSINATKSGFTYQIPSMGASCCFQKLIFGVMWNI